MMIKAYIVQHHSRYLRVIAACLIFPDLITKIKRNVTLKFKNLYAESQPR